MLAKLFSEAWLIVMVIVGFGFLIFIHEFGHFIVAKWKGVLVRKFSLGFGPALIHFTLGETEYAISLIPLGGYCKLAGEMMQPEEATGASGKKKEDEDVPPERLLGSKTVWQRMQIFAAGAILNLAAVFPLGILVALIGGQEAITQVTVGPGTAYEAGLHSGDIVKSVNGTPVKYRFEMEDAIEKIPAGRPFTMTVDRDGQELSFELTREDERDYLGLGNHVQPVIGGIHPTSAGRKAGLKIGDRIVSVKKLDEEPVKVESWSDFEAVARSSPGVQVTITVERENPAAEGTFETEEIHLTPEEVPRFSIGVKFDLDPYVGMVQGDSPAKKAGIMPGDRIVSIDGKDVQRWSDVLDYISAGGVDLAMVVARNGEEVSLAVHRSTADTLIGIAPPMDRPVIIGEVEPDSPAAAAGLQPGDSITKIDGKKTSELEDEIVLSEETATIEILRDGQKHTLKVTPEQRSKGLIGVSPMVPSEFRRPSVLGSFPEGISRALEGYSRTFVALGWLFTGRAPTKDMAGPVGIISMSYMQAETGLQQFVFFLMMISISLGIFNLFPVPVLDGGHIAFLLIEKVKGKPVSERAFITAQYVGLALLLCLVLFVTTNDVRNFFF